MPSSDGQPKRGLALVTGGSRGIGRAVALALATAGWKVIVWGRDEAALKETASLAPEGAASWRICDLADPAAIDAGFAALDEEGLRLRVVVNNAAIGIFGPCEDVELEDWDRVMAVNVRGAFRCSQQAFRRMKTEDGGRIINISSVVGRVGYANQVIYASSKHALMGMTKVMAREGQEHNVRVHAICPGGVATEMVAQARPDLNLNELIQPDDVAAAVQYLVDAPDSVVVDQLNLRRAGSTAFA
jgi:3-oxoacyl-[acyl-carrier protein] reductase